MKQYKHACLNLKPLSPERFSATFFDKYATIKRFDDLYDAMHYLQTSGYYLNTIDSNRDEYWFVKEEDEVTSAFE